MSREIKTLHKVTWVPILIMIVVFCSINFGYVYFRYLENITGVANEFRTHLHSNASYLREDIYYKKEKSLKIRIKRLSKYIKEKYKNIELCVKIKVTFNNPYLIDICSDNDLKEGYNNVVQDIFLGKKRGATITLKYISYFSIKDSIPAYFLASFVLSIFSAVITGLLLIRNVKQKIVNPLELKINKERENAILGTLSSQIAHDIRSPLTALDMVTKNITVLPEQERIIIRDSVARIKDIANNLLEQRRNVNSNKCKAGTTRQESFFLCAIVDSVVSEKKVQNMNNRKIQIKAALDEFSYGLFVNVNDVELKRILSNIITNSIEAMSDKGKVVLDAQANGSFVKVRIKDNGKGISPEIINKLGHDESSFGKEKGNGIGIYQAKKTIDSWGGQFTISSTVGEGTEVILKLPKAEPPSWFKSKLKISSSIVILDDDESIHHVWSNRFGSLKNRKIDINTYHFYTSEEIINWCKENSTNDCIFLCDFELIGDKYDGLSVIEELGIIGNSILVTSRYSDTLIKERCKTLGVKIIPKPMASIIPIDCKNSQIENSLKDKEKLSAKNVFVYIENDKVLRLYWASKAEEVGIDLLTFESPQDFKTRRTSISKESTFYIDQDYGELDNTTGEEFAKELYDQGYRNLYLATGYCSEDIGHLYWLKGIVGKESPWD